MGGIRVWLTVTFQICRAETTVRYDNRFQIGLAYVYECIRILRNKYGHKS